MATLYSQARSNVRKTWFLMALFLILIIGLGYAFSYIYDSPNILYIAVILAVSQSFASYWFSDKIVLSMNKARQASKESDKELYRIVENLSISSGMPMPKVYIMEEAQPNAFATGRDEKHAVVAVTRGLLEKLDRTELEGVIAHELAHIKNKDILLSTVIVVLVGIIALLSDFFLRMSFWGEGRSNKNGGGIALLIIGIIAAILAPLAATLIQLAVSRKREFLADASGALMTRYPEGLASALQKISADPTPMKAANNSTAHLFISSPFKGKRSMFSKLFMTHPPAQDRIKALIEMKN